MPGIKKLLRSYLTSDEQRIIFFLLLAGITGIIVHFTLLQAADNDVDSLRVAVAEPTEIRYDINTVTAEELQTIPGIGAVRAAAIIDYRDRNRPISVDDLLNVRGIGEKTLANLRGYFGERGEDVEKEMPQEGINEPGVQGTMNINDASLQDLMRVRGVGQVRGESILEFLEEVGRIKNIDQLLEVRGIGPKTLENIKEMFYADDDR